MYAYIKAIEYHLPENLLTNADLVSEFPEWSMEKIEQKTGITKRHIAKKDECSSDIGVEAAKKLFASGICKPTDIDYLILCTQSPDYFLPTTACIIQERLGIPVESGAIDINLGCSGFVYGLGIAKGIIETGQSKNLLFITAETYSKFIHPKDKSVRTLFGDGAAVTLISSTGEPGDSMIGPFIFGTDGTGAHNLIVPNGGLRSATDFASEEPVMDKDGNIRTKNNLYMNGSEIFTFTIKRVPETVNKLLKKAKIRMNDIDYFVFHQANKFMLDHLRKKIKIPSNKFCLAFEQCGNTVSSTIPIALKDALDKNQIKKGDLIMIIGFGVGYSWGGTIIRI